MPNVHSWLLAARAPPVCDDVSGWRLRSFGGLTCGRRGWREGTVRAGAGVVTSRTPSTLFLGRTIAGYVPNTPTLVTSWLVVTQVTHLTVWETGMKTKRKGIRRRLLKSPCHYYPVQRFAVLIEPTGRVHAIHFLAKGRVHTPRVASDEIRRELTRPVKEVLSNKFKRHKLTAFSTPHDVQALPGDVNKPRSYC